MKIKLKKKTGLTFGDFVAAAYQNWGTRTAANFVQLALKTRHVMFQKQPSDRPNGFMGRIKIGPKAALIAVLLGSAGFVTEGYSQIVVRPPRVEVEVPAPVLVAPPVIVDPDPGFLLYGGGYDRRDYGRGDARDFGRRGAESRRGHDQRGRDDHGRDGKRR